MPAQSENKAIGYWKSTFPKPITIGNKKANSIVTFGTLATRAGNKLIKDKSTIPTKMHPAAMVGAALIKNKGEAIFLTALLGWCCFKRNNGMIQMTCTNPIMKKGVFDTYPVIQIIIGPMEKPKAIAEV